MSYETKLFLNEFLYGRKEKMNKYLMQGTYKKNGLDLKVINYAVAPNLRFAFREFKKSLPLEIQETLIGIKALEEKPYKGGLFRRLSFGKSL